MDNLTEAQRNSWVRAMDRLKYYISYWEFIPTDIDGFGWTTSIGSDNTLNAIWADSDALVMINISKYGRLSIAVADVDFYHNDDDDMCMCDHCSKEREGES